MNRKLIVIGLVLLLISGIVFAQVITQDVMDKELENTLKDNSLAQAGEVSGYSFYTNETGSVDYTPSNCECRCECGN